MFKVAGSRHRVGSGLPSLFGGGGGASYRLPFAVPSRRGSAPPAHRPFPGAFANGAGALPRIPLNTMPCKPLLMSTIDTV